MLAAAPDDLRAIGLGSQGLGILLGDPGGHDSGGGAEDRGDSGGGELRDDPVQPAKIELALAWLQVGRPKDLVRGRRMTDAEAASYVREVASAKTAVLKMSVEAVERGALPFVGETRD